MEWARHQMTNQEDWQNFIDWVHRPPPGQAAADHQVAATQPNSSFAQFAADVEQLEGGDDP